MLQKQLKFGARGPGDPIYVPDANELKASLQANENEALIQAEVLEVDKLDQDLECQKRHDDFIKKMLGWTAIPSIDEVD